jgi:hypothetical protein
LSPRFSGAAFWQLVFPVVFPQQSFYNHLHNQQTSGQEAPPVLFFPFFNGVIKCL